MGIWVAQAALELAMCPRTAMNFCPSTSISQVLE